MQRSSESIGAIAAALAKAQIELINPEKSLTATIRFRERATAPSAMPRSPAASISSARPWASTRSQPCRPRPSTRRPGSFG
jgi:hypothetical protein